MALGTCLAGRDVGIWEGREAGISALGSWLLSVPQRWGLQRLVAWQPRLPQHPRSLLLSYQGLSTPGSRSGQPVAPAQGRPGSPPPPSWGRGQRCAVSSSTCPRAQEAGQQEDVGLMVGSRPLRFGEHACCLPRLLQPELGCGQRA